MTTTQKQTGSLAALTDLFTRKGLLSLATLAVAIACAGNAFAQTLTPASGGSAISADTTGGSWTSLTGPTYAEGTTNDVGVGTIVLNAPAGFEFDTGGAPPDVLVIGDPTDPSNNINNTTSNTTFAVDSTTAGAITVTITTGSGTNSGTAANTLTFENIRVRPTSGTPLASGNITDSGSATITGVTGSSNFGTLTEVAGNASQLAITTEPGGATAGSAFSTQPVVQTQDQFGNNSTESLGASVNVTIAINTGSGTLQGTTLYDIGTGAGNGTITGSGLQIDQAGDFTLKATAGGFTEGDSTSFTVSPAAASQLVITTPPRTACPSVNTPIITVQRQDAFGNPITADPTMQVDLTSSSAGGSFLADDGVTPITSTNILIGSSTASYIYQDSISGSPTITNADNAAVLTSATQAEVISANVSISVLTTSVCANATIQLTSATTGNAPLGGFTYQWRWAGVDLANGPKYADVTGPVLTITNVQASEAGNSFGGYSVVVYGCSASASNYVNLTVSDITVAPVSQTVCPGASASFGPVTAVGPGAISYIWRTNNVAIVNGGRFSGATSDTLTINPVIASDANWTYSVEATIGSCTKVTNAATLSLSWTATGPVATTACSNGVFSLSTVTSGAGAFYYQWYTNNGTDLTALTDDAKYSGTSSDTLTVNDAVASDAVTYSVVISNSACGAEALLTNSAAVTVRQNVSITTSPPATNVCPGVNISTLKVTAAGTSPTYQWFKDNVPVSENPPRVLGSKSNLLFITGVAASDEGSYTVVVSGPCATNEIISAPAAVTVNTTASSSTVIGPDVQTNCLGSTVIFPVTTSCTSPVFRWRTNGVNLANTIGKFGGVGTSTLYVTNLQGSEAGAGITYSVQVSNLCAATGVRTNSATVRTNATLVGPANQTNCVGSTASFTVAPVGNGPFTYVWRTNDVDLVGDTKFFGTNGATLYITNALPEEAGAGIVYSVEVTDGCGFKYTNSATLSLGSFSCPATVVVPADGGQCYATLVSLGVPSTVACFSSITNDALAIAQTNELNELRFPASTNYLFASGTNYVTWTAYDINGAASTCQQMVVVRQLTCPANDPRFNDPGQSYATAVALNTPASACNQMLLTNNTGVAALFPLGPTTFLIGSNDVVWTQINTNNGFLQTNTCHQAMIVEDNEGPTITCPENDIVIVSTLSTTLCATNVLQSDSRLVVPAAVDNTGAPVTVVTNNLNTLTNKQPTAWLVPGLYPLVWTAVDTNKNVNPVSCQQNLVVVDGRVPVISACAGNVTNAASSGLCVNTNVNLGTPTFADNCGATAQNDADAEGKQWITFGFPIGTNIVVWTVKDGAGNTTNPCNQTVMITNAVPACPTNLVVGEDAGLCYATLTPAAVGTPLPAGCGDITNTAVAGGYLVSGNYRFPLGVNTLTWTNVNANYIGGTQRCAQTITVLALTCPADIITNVQDQCLAEAVDLGAPVTGCNFVSSTNDGLSQFPSGNYPVGTNTVTWTAVFTGNITNTCSQLVIVQSTNAPAITAPDNVTNSVPATACKVVIATLGTPTTCTFGVVTNDAFAQGFTNNSGQYQFPVGSNVVQWTVTDTNGVTSDPAVQVVIVNDTIAPVISYCGAVTMNANGACVVPFSLLVTPIASDNCAPALSNNYPGVNIDLPAGTNYVTWTALDPSGNSASCVQVAIVRDITNTCAADIALTTALGLRISTNPPAPADISCLDPATTNNAYAQGYTNFPGWYGFPIGVNTLTWTNVSSGYGGGPPNFTNICVQLVTVTDDENPVLGDCPADIFTNALPGQCSVAANGLVLTPPSATDNDGVESVTYTAPGAYAIGTNIVTWKATDTNGNDSATCQQKVVVSESPLITWTLITCPPNITNTTLAFLQCYALVPDVGTPTFATNCSESSIVSYTNNLGDTNVFPLGTGKYAVGTNYVTWTAVDSINGMNATGTCQQVVLVIDTQAPGSPAIACRPNLTMHTLPGLCYATNAFLLLAPTVSDNCGTYGTTNSLMQTNYNGLVSVTSNAYLVYGVGGGEIDFPVGVNPVLWTATDAAGNTNSCVQYVTNLDTQLPVFTNCPADVMITNTVLGLCTYYTNLVTTNLVGEAPVVGDNCGVSSVVSNATGLFPPGTNVVTWTATDIHGNVNTCQQQVIVLAPTVTLTVTFDGSNLIISWPQVCGLLQETASLNDPVVWNYVSSPVVPVGDQYQVTVAVSGKKYYRLQQLIP